MLQPGDQAPDIPLATETGEPFDWNSLRGKKFVLFFFPKANTSG